MTDQAVLAELRERLRAATGPDRSIDGKLLLLEIALISPEEKARRAQAASEMLAAKQPITAPPNDYTASIDAAIALVERLLPGWRWVIHSPRSALGFGACLANPTPGGAVCPSNPKVKFATASLACLDALLSSLEER